jgi:hypothetical protein
MREYMLFTAKPSEGTAQSLVGRSPSLLSLGPLSTMTARDGRSDAQSGQVTDGSISAGSGSIGVSREALNLADHDEATALIFADLCGDAFLMELVEFDDSHAGLDVFNPEDCDVDMSESALPPLSINDEPITAAASLLHSSNLEKVRPSKQELRQCCSDRDREALLSWYQRFNEWLYFKQIQGHGSVPQNNPKADDSQGSLFGDVWSKPLANWVNKQRREKTTFDSGTISKYMYSERIELLEEHGFEWATPKDVFNDHFNKLLEFHRIVGNADVPVKPFDKDKDEAPKAQVEAVVAGLLQGRDTPADDRATLVCMLLDKKFTRWITSMRDEYKKWHKFEILNSSTNTNEVPAKTQRKYENWKLRKERLDSVGFRYVILVRNQS